MLLCSAADRHQEAVISAPGCFVDTSPPWGWADTLEPGFRWHLGGVEPVPAAWGAGCGALASPQEGTGQPSSSPGPAGEQELFADPGVRAGAAPYRVGLESRSVPGVSPCWNGTS